MTRSRRLRILVVLALLVGMRVVYAAPAEVTAELRAVSCCTQHTGQPSSVPAARHCCQVASIAGTQAMLSATPRVTPPHATFALPVAAPMTSVVRAPTWWDTTPDSAPRDGPPLYIGLLNIRR